MLRKLFDRLGATLHGTSRLGDEDLRLVIELVYRLHLDRPPDPAGERTYLRELRNGLPISELVRQIAGSAEARQAGRSMIVDATRDRSLPEKLDGEWAHRKLLLCRPNGGLNDMLCQIGKCLRYSLVYDRMMIVDTAYEDRVWASGSFGDTAAYYFQSLEPQLHLAESPHLPSLDHLDVVPAYLRGRLDSYIGEWERSIDQLVEIETRQPISFDFDKRYAERLLVHHGAGGGLASLAAIRALVIRPHLKERLVERLSLIGRPYEAVHIRHSDYKTDYGAAIKAIPADSGAPIFVATDNAGVLDAFRDVFGRRVVSFTTILGSEKTPLHRMRLPPEAARRRNTETILDVLTLAFASKRYLFPVRVDPSANGSEQIKFPLYSGFSMLAESLAREPRLLAGFVGGLDDIDAALGGAAREKTPSDT